MAHEAVHPDDPHAEVPVPIAPDFGPAHDEHHPGVGHLVSPKILIATAGTLLALTVLTVVSAKVDFAQFDLQELNIWVALTIAGVKAALVCLFFMHLRWDRPFNAFVLVSSLAFAVLFIAFAMTDTTEYHNDVIPGDSKNVMLKLTELPALQQTADEPPSGGALREEVPAPH